VAQFKGRIVTESLDIMLLIDGGLPRPQAPAAAGRRGAAPRAEPPAPGAPAHGGLAAVREAPLPRGSGAGAWFGGAGGGGGGAQEAFEGVMVAVDEAIARSGGPYFLGAEVRVQFFTILAPARQTGVRLPSMYFGP